MSMEPGCVAISTSTSGGRWVTSTITENSANAGKGATRRLTSDMMRPGRSRSGSASGEGPSNSIGGAISAIIRNCSMWTLARCPAPNAPIGQSSDSQSTIKPPRNTGCIGRMCFDAARAPALFQAHMPAARSRTNSQMPG